MDKPVEIINAKDWNPTESHYYHIQIHFKRKVKGSRGSIGFDQKKDGISKIIKCCFDCSNKIEVEDREFHAANISRVSICRTEQSKSELLDKVIGPKSQKFDYLMEIANPTNRWKIESKIIGCHSGEEWLKINGLLLLVPLIGGVASYLYSKFLLNWSDKDVWGMVLPVIGIGFGLGTILKREL